MKNILFVFILLSTNLFAQDVKYVAAMEKNVAILDSAKELTTYQNVNNSFERIAAANQKEWLPVYYRAYCTVLIGMKQEDNLKKDEYYDKATQLINKADSLKPDNSEIYVLNSMINSMKISVDPMNRGQKLGMQSAMLNAKAVELDKENPRAYLLKGSGLMYTPPQYGGGKDKALPVLELAVEKFKSFKPVDKMMPRWGESRAQFMLEQCKKQD